MVSVKTVRLGHVFPDMRPEDKFLGEEILKKACPFCEFVPFDSVDILIKLLLNSSIEFDSIHIDINHLHQSGNTPEMIRSISKLVKVRKIKTQIFANVDEETNCDLIREYIPVVDGISIRSLHKPAGSWTMDDVIKNIYQYTLGDLSLPELVQKKLALSPQKKRVVVVSHVGITDTPEATEDAKNMLAGLGAEYLCVPQLSLLYTLLNDENFRIDVIGIDLNQLYQTSGDQAFTEIQTIYTLINSLYFVEDNVYKPRSTSIVGGVTLETDPKIIREFLSLKGVTGVMPQGVDFTLGEKYEAMSAYLNKKHHVPRRIHELINPNRITKRARIDLTTRESQIYNIIVERGVSNKQIARMLGVSEPTVKMHIGNILKKYNVRNRTQLVAFK